MPWYLRLLDASVIALLSTTFCQCWVAAQEARGVAVSSRLWQDTPHCEHYRFHPEKYTAELLDFTSSLQ